MTTQTEAMKLRIANDLVKYAELVEDEALISPEEMNCASLMRLAAEILADHIPDTTKMVAQPEQEPVVWMYVNRSTHETIFQRHMRSFVDHGNWTETPLYSEPLANHELNCVCGAVWCGDEMVHLPHKSTPPQRKPLTDEMVVAAARVLNERQADACGVDRDDQWAIYSDDFKADALAMLKAAHGIKGDA